MESLGLDSFTINALLIPFYLGDDTAEAAIFASLATYRGKDVQSKEFLNFVIDIRCEQFLPEDYLSMSRGDRCVVRMGAKAAVWVSYHDSVEKDFNNLKIVADDSRFFEKKVAKKLQAKTPEEIRANYDETIKFLRSFDINQLSFQYQPKEKPNKPEPPKKGFWARLFSKAEPEPAPEPISNEQDIFDQRVNEIVEEFNQIKAIDFHNVEPKALVDQIKAFVIKFDGFDYKETESIMLDKLKLKLGNICTYSCVLKLKELELNSLLAKANAAKKTAETQTLDTQENIEPQTVIPEKPKGISKEPLPTLW